MIIKTILLGSSGFIGKGISKYLIKSKFKFFKYNSKNLNLLNLKLTRKTFNNIKNNYALIISSAVIDKNHNNKKNAKKNILMIENIIKSVDRQKLKKIIFLSTTDVYGKKHKSKINENSKINPQSEYAKSKLICEKKLKLFCKDIPLVILRLPGIYGYEDNFKSTIGNLFKQSIFDKEILLNKDGKEKRDYIYIDDLSKIILKLISNSFIGILNIVSGKSVTIKKISISIAKLNNSSVKIKSFGLNRKLEHLLFDNKLLLSIFPGYRFVNFNIGIKNYINSYIKNNKNKKN